jgi:anaerobic selenocysteine-containing dehydrogenase
VGANPRTVPQVALPDIVQAGQFKFIYIHLMNPIMTLPNQQAFRNGLSRPDVFVAVHETHWTNTTQYADAVLPAHTFLEKDDLVIPWSHGYVQLSRRVVPPLTQGLNEIALMRGLAQRLGLERQWLYASPWPAVRRAFEAALEDGTWRDLRAGSLLRLRRKPREHYPTPSGKIEFESSLALQHGWDPLPRQASLHEREGRLILLTSATPKYTHTQFQEVYGAIPAAVHMHPRDAERLGIQDGQAITLDNELGRFRARAVLSDALPQGVLWAPRQSEGLAGHPQNTLMNSQPQSIGGGPRFNSTSVTISRT